MNVQERTNPLDWVFITLATAFLACWLVVWFAIAMRRTAVQWDVGYAAGARAMCEYIAADAGIPRSDWDAACGPLVEGIAP